MLYVAYDICIIHKMQENKQYLIKIFSKVQSLMGLGMGRTIYLLKAS